MSKLLGLINLCGLQRQIELDRPRTLYLQNSAFSYGLLMYLEYILLLMQKCNYTKRVGKKRKHELLISLIENMLLFRPTSGCAVLNHTTLILLLLHRLIVMFFLLLSFFLGMLCCQFYSSTE